MVSDAEWHENKMRSMELSAKVFWSCIGGLALIVAIAFLRDALR